VGGFGCCGGFSLFLVGFPAKWALFWSANEARKQQIKLGEIFTHFGLHK